MNHDSNNIMVILSSPSGAGKTTISKKIQQKYQNFKISVSHTTRKPRPNEVEGIDYYFINENDFQKPHEMICYIAHIHSPKNSRPRL